MRRHCIAHVHSVPHPACDLFFENIERDRDIFDGEKIASLTDGPCADSYEARLQESGFTVLRMQNNAGREKDGFFGLALPLLCGRAHDGLVFVTHSKGTSHNPSSPAFPWIVHWIRAMWQHNVSEYATRIEPHINDYVALGTLRKTREKVASVHHQEYHFSGTFFWMRLDALIERKWQDRVRRADEKIAALPPTMQDHYRRYFAEAFPSLITNLAESYSVVDVEGNTYQEPFWKKLSARNV